MCSGFFFSEVTKIQFINVSLKTGWLAYRFRSPLYVIIKPFMNQTGNWNKKRMKKNSSNGRSHSQTFWRPFYEPLEKTGQCINQYRNYEICAFQFCVIMLLGQHAKNSLFFVLFLVFFFVHKSYIKYINTEGNSLAYTTCVLWVSYFFSLFFACARECSFFHQGSYIY